MAATQLENGPTLSRESLTVPIPVPACVHLNHKDSRLRIY